MNYKILICIVNFNNSNEVLDYIDEVKNQKINEKIKIMITDNSTIFQEKIKLKEKIKEIREIDITILETKENLGYLNGLFLGVKKFHNKYKYCPEWIVFSNTDIKFKNLEFFQKLLSTKYNKDIYCIAPSVYSTKTNSYQNPHYIERISEKKLQKLIFISSCSFLFGIYSKLADFKAKISKKEKRKSQNVYAAHGCFFVLSNKYFENDKNPHYGAFLYSEEAYIAETILKKNGVIFYDESLQIIHKENSTTSLLGNFKRAKYINKSLIYIYDKFYRKSSK
ncbi:MAG: glycosyltransferase family 2 protein [Cetobacterium sp.]